MMKLNSHSFSAPLLVKHGDNTKPFTTSPLGNKLSNTQSPPIHFGDRFEKIVLGVSASALLAIGGLFTGAIWSEVSNRKEADRVAHQYVELNAKGTAQDKVLFIQNSISHQNPKVRAWAYTEIPELHTNNAQKIKWFLQGLRDKSDETFKSARASAQQFGQDLSLGKLSSEDENIVPMFQKLLLKAPGFHEEMVLTPTTYDGGKTTTLQPTYNTVRDSYTIDFTQLEQALKNALNSTPSQK